MKNMCSNKIIFNNDGLDIHQIRILAVYESKNTIIATIPLLMPRENTKRDMPIIKH